MVEAEGTTARGLQIAIPGPRTMPPHRAGPRKPGSAGRFRARRLGRIVKIVAWDGSGLRLEHGAFRWPPIADGMMRLTSAQLAALVDGMDWSRLHARDVTRPTASR
jgi:transposase